MDLRRLISVMPSILELAAAPSWAPASTPRALHPAPTPFDVLHALAMAIDRAASGSSSATGDAANTASPARARALTSPLSAPLTLESLFRDHAGDVHRIVARLLGPGARPADIEDLTQQVFLAAHRALPGFRGDSKPSTWLYGIASRVVLTHLRGRKRHRRMVERLETELLAPLPVPADSAEDQLDQREQLRTVWRCLMEINPKKRIVFMLHEIEGLSGKEIAEALDLKEATVFTRLYHARRELLAALKERR